jgi:hypothetical protein
MRWFLFPQARYRLGFVSLGLKVVIIIEQLTTECPFRRYFVIALTHFP